MADKRVNVEQDSHFDGKKEGIIADSIGKEIGLRSDVNSSTEEANNPFHVESLKKDSKLKRFDQTFK